jgi:uncharacterized membrane protein YdbT with pleckstrin-like domain
VPYPDKLLADGEEVVAHLHPHAVAAFWPVVRLLSVVGAASFGAAMVPAGGLQRSIRLAIAAVALLLVVLSVAGPLLRWRTTHYVITTHRLLHRSGVLTRRGRDIPLSRITDVSFSQTLWERVIRAGTLAVTSAGDGTTVLRRVPISERVQQLLNHMIEEDAVRRGQGSPGHHGDDGRQSADRWDAWTTGAGWTDSDPGLVTVRGVTERLAVEGRTGPVR